MVGILNLRSSYSTTIIQFYDLILFDLDISALKIALTNLESGPQFAEVWNWAHLSVDGQIILTHIQYMNFKVCQHTEDNFILAPKSYLIALKKLSSIKWSIIIPLDCMTTIRAMIKRIIINIKNNMVKLNDTVFF